MTWIDLSKIDAVKFRAGYVPDDYHDIIKFAKDGRFMYPRVIEPISTNFQDRQQLMRFLNTWKMYFDLDMNKNITSVNNYSYMPGPGEIRPTHVVFRYDTFTGPGAPGKKFVMKICDSHYGHQEFRRQEMFYKKGFFTPKPYVFCNYFTEVEFFFKDMRKSVEHSIIREVTWLLSFLREIEVKKRDFNALKDPAITKRITNIIDVALGTVKDGRNDLLEKFRDDLSSLADGIFDNLEFKGFLFMEYIENTISFEQILFDRLGGIELEKASGAFEVLSKRPELGYLDLTDGIIAIMLKLWNMGERHNDMKGEHFLYDYINKRWYLIDWGELVKGPIGRDLGVFLADTTTFIRDRCKFNMLFGKKNPGCEPLLEKHRARIMERADRFWTQFLDNISQKIPTTVFSDAYRIVKDRQLTFEASKLEPYC